MHVKSTEGTSSGKTAIKVEETAGSGNTYKYKVGVTVTVPSVGAVCSSGYTNWNGTDEITAESGKTIVIVEVDNQNKCVATGTATVVAKA